LGGFIRVFEFPIFAEMRFPVKPSRKKSREKKSALYAISEHSLLEILENEPDLYSVSDLKVRYK
jgi:hypothetical protein